MGLTHDQVLEALKVAAQRAATEAVPWLPGNEDSPYPGDSVAGRVVSTGRFAIKHNPMCIFTTLETVPEKTGDPFDTVRVGWVGKVLEAAGEQYLPIPGDFVVMQYLGKRPQKDGMDDYSLTQAVVLGPDGLPKVPVGFEHRAQAERMIQAGSLDVGELAGMESFTAD